MFLEGRNLKSSSQKDYTTYGGSGKNSSLPLPASGGSMHSLVSLAVPLQFLFPWSHFFLFLCLHLHFILFQRKLSLDFRHTWIIHDDLMSSSLIIYAQIIFPNKGGFTEFGLQGISMSGGGYSSFNPLQVLMIK